ncbi:MAG: DUF192 domain-containing protein [Nanoarchaeota archaeon]|nr:DUF192 domain-containing protein [Nanoarchaeota archaeon]
MKTFKLVPLLLLSMFLFSCTKTTNVTVHGDEKVTFQTEIADTKPKQTKGLMFRKELPEDQGMLFVFSTPSHKRFWMMNTSIPLDIIFIDENKSIINIEEAKPCGIIPYASYLSTGKAQYVLEINQGLSKEYDFKPGMKVEFNLE